MRAVKYEMISPEMQAECRKAADIYVRGVSAAIARGGTKPEGERLQALFFLLMEEAIAAAFRKNTEALDADTLAFLQDAVSGAGAGTGFALGLPLLGPVVAPHIYTIFNHAFAAGERSRAMADSSGTMQ